MPTFTAAGTFVGSAGTASPGIPAGTLADDILLLFVETENESVSLSDAQGFASVGVPTGTGAAGGTTSSLISVFWKRATGSDVAPTVADAGDHVACRILGFRGVKTSGDPWNGTPTWSIDATSDTSGSAAGPTTTAPNCLVVIGAANVIDTNTSQTVSYSNANLTNLGGSGAGDNTNQGSGGGFNVGIGEKVTAGAVGTTTITYGNATNKSMVVIALEGAVTPISKTLTPATEIDVAPTNYLTYSGSPTANSDSSTTIDSTGSDRVQGPSYLLNPTQGWMAIRFKVAFTLATYTDILSWGNSNNGFVLYWRNGAGESVWDVRRESTSASLQLLVVDTVATDQEITLIYAWTSTDIKLSVDGGAFESQGNTEIPTVTNTPFDIGFEQFNATWINSPVYWVAGGTGTLSDTDAATINTFGNTDPTPSGLPGTPTFVWPASSNHFKTSDSIAYVSKALTPTSATETGAAQVLDITAGGGGPINVSITPADETDAAVALVATKPIVKTVTEATETDAAQALSVTKPIVKAVTAATETDAAQAVTFTKTIVKSVTAATETDAAQVLSITKTILKSITAATEVDEAQILSFVKPIYKTLTETTETDSAEILDFTFGGGGGPIEVTLTPATETSTAEALTLFKSLAVAAVTETDAAQALIGYKSVVITPSTETDESVGLTVYKPLSITPVSETDAAQALTLYKSLTLTAASEADSALALAITKTIYKTLTLAGETDAAIALSFTGGEAPVVRRTVGPIIIGRF